MVNYAKKISFGPGVTQLVPNKLNYTGYNVTCTDYTEVQREKLLNVLQKHEGIIIPSGNAIPHPAYGDVWGRDVRGHDLITQQARRVPLRHLSKAYEI